VATIAVLGPVAVHDGRGRPVELRSLRSRRLLAVLTAHWDEVVPADMLVAALWGDDLPARPAAALQSQVFRLRRMLGDTEVQVRTEGTGYRLAGDTAGVDAHRFGELVDRAAGEPIGAARLALLDEALTLWRGPAYHDVADIDPLSATAARLDECRVEVAETRAETLVELGRAGEALASLTALAAEQPWRERPVALGMRALAAAGRHTEAVRLYQSFRSRLADELGLEPSPDLRALEGAILRHDQPQRATIGLPGNSFVGREVDLAEAVMRLDQVRLVTLTGPGGVGKSRLARHIAARVGDRHPDGIFLCELAQLRQPHEVAGAVASQLRIEGAAAGTSPRIVDVLQARRVLLVLDNCEHVLAGVRGLVTALLARTSDVVVLATSRERLGVEGEHVRAVHPLPAPGEHDGRDRDEGGPALALFVERAQAVRPDLVLDTHQRAAASELCRRLDGLPLAIELAAARTVTRLPSEILDAIAGRTGELTGELTDPRRAVDRHRSMEAVVDWSLDLLEPDERALFAQISVFADGFTAEAAAAVTGVGAVGDAITALVEQSLLGSRRPERPAGAAARNGPAERPSPTRYAMLEPVRQHAEVRLARAGDLPATRGRHAAWAAAWMGVADADLRSPQAPARARAVDAELGNLRAAHRWCIEHDPAGAARLAGHLYWYGYLYGPVEVCAWAMEVVERIGPSDPGPYATAALGAWRAGDLDAARALARRGIAAAPDDPAARFAWQALSAAELLGGRYEAALETSRRAQELARIAGDPYHEVFEQARGALALGYLGRRDEAAAEVAAAVRRAGENGATGPAITAFCDYTAGEILVEDDPSAALPLLRTSLVAARASGSRFLAGIAGVSALTCAARLGDPADSLGDYADLVDHWHRTGAWLQLWTTLRTLILALARAGGEEDAAVLHGALMVSGRAGPVVGADATRLDEAVLDLRARLGERFEELHDRGKALDDEQAVAYVRSCVVR
jgi:predicted ATPase/DNA-binding SARP family transcriptional activator